MRDGHGSMNAVPRHRGWSTIAALLLMLAVARAVLSPPADGAEAETRAVGSAAGADPWSRFAQTYCISRHGPDKQRGRIRLDGLVAGDVTDQSYGLWRHVLTAIDKREMPPEEARRHPSTTEAAAIRSMIAGSLTSAEQTGRLTRPETPLKRLNRLQYRNSLRDLLHIETTMADPTRGFPDDRGDPASIRVRMTSRSRIR